MGATEEKGLRIVIDYEKKQGRHPFSVHSGKDGSEYSGMDIISVDLKGKQKPRLIEVKTTRQEGKGIPDAYSSEFIESFSGLRFRATHLYVVQILKGKKPTLAVIPKSEIDKYAKEHKKLVSIRFANPLKTNIEKFRVKH